MGKKLGQNFLKSSLVRKEIVDNINPKIKNILEIGPGKGFLTSGLLGRGFKVVAVELDKGLFNSLENKFEREIRDRQLVLICGDALDLPWTRHLRFKTFAVVSNIPYYITGKLIKILLTSRPKPKEIILLIQREVAKRILDQKESLLSLSVKYYSTPKYVKSVSKKAFSPSPRVDSSIIKLEDLRKRTGEKEFFEIINKAFSSKRKVVLKKFPASIQKKLEDLGVTKQTRAENVDIEIWEKLLNGK